MSQNFFRVKKGTNLEPTASPTLTDQGDMAYDSADDKLKVRGASVTDPVVQEAKASSLTNKTLDSDLNTLSNIKDSDIKAAAAITRSKLASGSANHVIINDGSGVLSSEAQLASSRGGTGADLSAATGVVHVTAGVTTASNVVNADVDAAAAIARSKLASGSVDHVIINDGSGVLSSEAALSAARGGTGVSNNAAATLTRSGNHAVTLTTSATTSLTLPTSGTLATLAGTETLSNKEFSDSLLLDEIATPSNPAATKLKFYAKSDNKLYFLNSAGVETQLASGTGTSLILTVTAGESLAARDAVYIDASDGFAYKASGAQTLIKHQFIGFTTAAISAAATGSVQIAGEMTGFSGLTVGALYYLSVSTSGAIVDKFPTLDASLFTELFYRVPVGVATSASTLLVNSGSIEQEKVIFSGRNELDLNCIANSKGLFNTQGWEAYKDAASSVPVDGTGGSPSIALSIDASFRFRRENNFQIDKPASNVQGEGISTRFNIAPSDAYRTMEISFDTQTQSTYVGGSNSDLRVYIYKIAGSAHLITPSSVSVQSNATGITTYKATFEAEAAGPYRLILHWANTGTTALSFWFSEVKIAPQKIASGPAMTDYNTTTVTFAATVTAPTKGTTSVDQLSYRRVGDSMEMILEYYQTAAGTNGSGNYKFVIPQGLSIDLVKAAAIVNVSSSNVGSASLFDGTNFYEGHVSIFDANSLVLTALNDTTALTAQSDAFVGLGTTVVGISFKASVPIAGWSTNVVAANSSVMRIADILQNGTRVTGAAPAALGEYRSQLRDAAALTFSDTNGSPTTAPSSANGIKLYNGNAFASIDTSNEPTWYEIFVGKNKTIMWQYYSSTGRTGEVDTSGVPFSTTVSAGYRKGYDPTTGVAWISPVYFSTGETSHHSGASQGAFVDDVYFDIIVSENALQVQQEVPISEVHLQSDNGFGSTNTAIRRFSTSVINQGSDITYSDSATLGASFTINQTGIYSMSFNDTFSSTTNMGISKNSSQLTTGISSITQADVLGVDGAEGSDRPGLVSITLHLRSGDIIRPHTETSLTAGTVVNAQSFRIIRIA